MWTATTSTFLGTSASFELATSSGRFAPSATPITAPPFRTLFRFLQADIVQLHQTYGPQPLRGYDPEPDRNYDDSDDGGGEGGDNDPLQEEQLSFSGKSEEEWAEIVFDLGRHAKYFENRSNDGYAATLTLAPLISTSFLKFLLARKVFPNQSQRIDGCLQVCDAATKHLLPASILYKQLLNHSSLSSAVDRLFPSIDSTLVLPSDASKLDGPSVASSGDAVPQDELGEVEAATNEVKPSPDDERKPSGRDAGKQGGGWKSKGKGKGRASVEGTSKGGAETWSKMASDEANSPFSRLAKQVELDASVRRQWSSPSSTLSSTVDAFLSSAQRLHLLPSASTTGEGEEVEGVWRVGQRELSARTLRGWKVVSGIRTEKKVKQTSGRAGEKSGEDEMGKGADGLLVELQLSEHEDAFPLTTRTERSEIKAGIDEVDNHTLSSPISLIIHLPSTFSLDTLTALKFSLLEASLVQLVLVPYSPSSARPSSLWLPSRIHRIIPSYWTTQQELLRDQPLDRSFETSWEGEGEEGSVTVEEIKEKWSREERQREAEAAEEGGEALTSVGDEKGAGCLGKQSGEALTARNNGSELEGEKGTA